MKEAILYEKLTGKRESEVLCRLCSQYCLIKEGDKGYCSVRINENGKLYTATWGKATGTAVDPVEKKPFYHFIPGSRVLSFGTPGCNFKCDNCQNWNLSQQPELLGSVIMNENILEPEKVIQTALKTDSQGIAYTYSEPTIFFEYAYDVIKSAKEKEESSHLKHMFISNGFFSRELLDLFEKQNIIDAVNIDLKFISNNKYKDVCGGRLYPVLRSIKRINEMREKIHLEIINLIVSAENDSKKDIEKLIDTVIEISRDIPIHFSRFFPHYKMDDRPPTNLDTMLFARELAVEKGMNYTFLGNVNIPETSNTYCPGCKRLLIERSGYTIKRNFLENSSNCPSCSAEINIVI